MDMKSQLPIICVVLLACFVPASAQKSSDNPNPQDCSKLPDHGKLKAALTAAVKEGQDANGGLGNQQRGTVVNRDGTLCAVVFTGPNPAAEWPGRPGVSAVKANTAYALNKTNFGPSA